MEPRPDEVGAGFLPGPAAEAALAEREGYLLTAALSQRLDLIRHLIDFSRQIVLVVGDEGSGKTSLLHHLLATAPQNWRLAKINADPMCDADALMKRLCAEFDLHFAEQQMLDERIAGFHAFLAASRRALLVPVVLVDDAHLLPADALLLLLQLAQPESDAPNLRVALMCDARITRLLGSPQLHAFKDSLTHTVEMAPFTLEDTASYLARHWPAADEENSPILDERFIRDVHTAGGGIPGRINALVRTSLEEPAAIAEAHAPEPPRLRFGFSLLGGALALLVAAGMWLFLRSEPQRTETTSVAEPVSLPIGSEPIPPVTPPVVSERPADVFVPSPVAAQPPPPQSVTPNPERPSVSSTPAPAESPAVSPAAGAAVPPLAKQELPSAPPARPQPQAQSAAVGSAPNPEVKPVPVTQSKPPTETRVAAAKPAAHASGSSNWLDQQSKSHYVLQLYASYQRASAQQFIAANDLGSKARVLTTVRDNKTWYVVVYGPYGERSRAKAAIPGLPLAVQKLKPWVRPVSDLQAIAAD